MSQPSEGGGERRYADELRGHTDSGRTGDKVAYPDPAAAPLGTDDEAAGFPPGAAAVSWAIEQETANESAAGAAPRPSATLEGGPAYVLLTLIVAGTLMMMFYAISNLR